MKTEQPLWGRGIMVLPHFSATGRVCGLVCRMYCPTGPLLSMGGYQRHLRTEALRLGRLQAHHLHVRFQDGTLIDTDNADTLPRSCRLNANRRR